MNIVILDGYAANPGDLSWDRFKTLGDLTVYPRSRREEVVERAHDAEIILTNKVSIDDELMGKLPKLRYIGVLATGYNIIDTQAARKRGIVVTNIPAYSTMSVAQMVFAHILNITNHVAHYADATRKGIWSSKPDFCYWDTPLPELAGKTLGIVGLGHIGTAVAKIGHSFGMYISAYTRKNSQDLPEWIQKTTMDGLFAVSDILTLHCPLTLNEADVAAALRSGHLAAYGADVMTEEPPKSDNPLIGEPHAFITPHVAWATLEARSRLMDIALGNVRAFLNREPKNVVN